MKNILVVNNIPFNPVAGGIERVTDVLTKALIEKGYHIYYLCGNKESFSSNLLNYDFPAPLYFLPNSDFFTNEENVAYYTMILNKFSIDIVINQRGLRGCWPNLTLPNKDSSSFKSIKILNVVHSVPNVYTIQFLKSIEESLSYSTNLKDLIKVIIKKIFLPILLMFWKRVADNELKKEYRLLATHSDAIITLSDEYSKTIKKYIGNNEVIVQNIPNPTAFTCEAISIRDKEKIVLWVGRLDVEKNPYRMLEVWKRIQNKHQDWKLYIIGDGVERHNIFQYIKVNHLKNVVCVGAVADVTSYYKRGCIVCNTSDYEGWPMVLNEAMTFGCISFSFDGYGAVSEIIESNVNGVQIPAYDVKYYAQSLHKLMQNEKKMKTMYEKTLLKSKSFSLENVVKSWIKLFETLN